MPWPSEQSSSVPDQSNRRQPGQPNSDGETQEPETDAAARTLIGDRPEENTHGAEDIQPKEKWSGSGISRAVEDSG